MSDLISRQDAIDAIGKKSDEIYKTKQKGATYPHDDFFQGMAYAENIVKQLPSAERKGKWIVEKDATGYRYGRCSECGMTQYAGKLNYCPNCGADMRGEEDGEH